MITKNKHYREKVAVPIGLHLARIKDVRFARTLAGDYIVDKATGSLAIAVTFATKHGDVVENIPVTEAFQWAWDNLSRAIRIDNQNGGEIPASKAIGRMLYITIYGEVQFDENGPIVSAEGVLAIENKLSLKFYEDLGMKPVLGGDPENNNGVPADDFIKPKNFDLSKYQGYVTNSAEKVDNDEF